MIIETEYFGVPPLKLCGCQMCAYESQTIRAVGEIKHGFYGDEMIHPKIRDAESSGLAESLTPIYPTVNGLNQPTLRRIIQTALDVTPLHDTLPDALLGRLKLPHLADYSDRKSVV